MASRKQIIEITIDGATTVGDLAALMTDIPDSARVSVIEATDEYSILRLVWS